MDILYTFFIFAFFWTYSVGAFLVSRLGRQYVELEDEDGPFGHMVLRAPWWHTVFWFAVIPYLVITGNFEEDEVDITNE